MENAEADLKALEKQAKCYTATVNCLRLVKKEDAWIVKPVTEDREMEVSRLQFFFFSHFTSRVPDSRGLTFQLSPSDLKRQVEVLELKDVEKELALCRARLKLMKFSPDSCNKLSSILTAQEIVGVLSNVGLYKDALRICSLFGKCKCN